LFNAAVAVRVPKIAAIALFLMRLPLSASKSMARAGSKARPMRAPVPERWSPRSSTISFSCRYFHGAYQGNAVSRE